MYSALSAFRSSASTSPEMPRIPALKALYDKGVRFRQGEVVMIAGRSGTQKSGFAMWLVANWNLPTLYLSADMSSYQASTRLACTLTGMTTDEVEDIWKEGGHAAAELEQALAGSNVSFQFGEITYQGLDNDLAAWVERYNRWPAVVVIDNLMDVEDAQSDYAAQMEVMQMASRLASMTGATVMVLHHASDKSWNATERAYMPPSRAEVKGGLSEKPHLSLSVALDPDLLDYRVACIKQRMGPCDPTGNSYATLRAEPERTRFHALARANPATGFTSI